MPTTKLTLFVVNKDEWYTKEGHGKSMRAHCMYSGMAKGTSRAEVTLNSKKIKLIARNIILMHKKDVQNGPPFHLCPTITTLFNYLKYIVQE